jgi:hypothetical protein
MQFPPEPEGRSCQTSYRMGTWYVARGVGSEPPPCESGQVGLLDPVARQRLRAARGERWVSYPCEAAFVGVGRRVLSCNRYKEEQGW